MLVVNEMGLEASIEGINFADHIENGLRVHTGGGRISAVLSADQFSD